MTDARKATMEDIPFIVSLARRSYPEYTLADAEAWTAKIISLPNAAMFVCGDAVATVAAQCEFWNPGALVSDVLPMFGHPTKDNPLGVFKALSAAADWSRDIGCYGMRFGSSIGAYASNAGRPSSELMEPFARRMGAYHWGSTYMKEFERCRPQYQS